VEHRYSTQNQLHSVLPVFPIRIALQRNLIDVFPEKELRVLCPNFHIHTSVNDLYIPTFGPPIFLLRIGRLIRGAAQFLFNEYLFLIFGIVSLQCVLSASPDRYRDPAIYRNADPDLDRDSAIYRNADLDPGFATK
jgi:hypothetical protein